MLNWTFEQNPDLEKPNRDLKPPIEKEYNLRIAIYYRVSLPCTPGASLPDLLPELLRSQAFLLLTVHHLYGYVTKLFAAKEPGRLGGLPKTLRRGVTILSKPQNSLLQGFFNRPWTET